MAKRSNDKSIGGSGTGTDRPLSPGHDIQPPPVRETRGSGTDKLSDTERLKSPDALQDKTEEDTFPASDPPSTSPVTGVGPDTNNPEDVDDFKNNPKRQFQYGRKTEEATLHFDRNPHRLETGNPDVGDVDLGTIEADKPAQPDDLDPYDSIDDDKDPANEY